MLFNSLDFAIFLPVVFLVYWFVLNRNLKLQNIFLLLASYFFYGMWDYRFLSLLIFSSFMDYILGIRLDAVNKPAFRKLFLIISIIINLTLLGFFKYFNFFAESFSEAFSFFGAPFDYKRLNIILPVGISFYAFKSMSYIIDIYFRKIKPTRDPINYLAYVAFFPQLVAGPIERATNLLPQFSRKREFDMEKAKDGLRQILWGLFKKLVIADNCAKMVNLTFGNYKDIHGPILFLGTIYFAIQIYCDFSGYSDIAIGTARLFGFRIMRNFNFPYFSRDIAEFWRRWHISLSTWFRDYVYIPLGGSKVSLAKKIRNIMIVFVVSGFWYGANWTFLIWGALNAIYFLPLLLSNKNRQNLDTPAHGRFFPSLREFGNIILTFSLTCFAWIFFRSLSLHDALGYIGNMFTVENMTFSFTYFQYLPVALVFFLIEWIQRDKQHALEISSKPVFFRRISYLAVIIVIFSMGVNTSNTFIYFQF